MVYTKLFTYLWQVHKENSKVQITDKTLIENDLCM